MISLELFCFVSLTLIFVCSWPKPTFSAVCCTLYGMGTSYSTAKPLNSAMGNVYFSSKLNEPFPDRLRIHCGGGY